MQTIKISGKDYPVVLNKRVWLRWEKDTGLRRSQLEANDTVENTFKLIHLSLIEGAKKSGEKLDLSQDDLIDADDSFIEEQFVEVLIDEGKKRSEYYAAIQKDQTSQ